MTEISDFNATEGDYRLHYALLPSAREDASVVVPASHPHIVSVSMKACGDGQTETDGTHLIFNHHREVYWHKDFQSKPIEAMSFSKVLSSEQALPTCHDLNQLKQGQPVLELLIGFSTGDIIFRELFSHQQLRFNTDGRLVKHRATAVCWIPGEESFLCGFADGSLLHMSIDRAASEIAIAPSKKGSMGFQVLHGKDSVSNPVAQWSFGVETGAIHAIAFSPDCTCAALVCAAGLLCVVDVRAERLLFSASSYFGALYCAAWSPDGQYIITGGQDDLVTIWSFKDRDIVARAQGHKSWVTGVAFDPYRTCDEMCYRFGSVGQDTRLCLWDFSAASLRCSWRRQPRRNSMAAHLSTLQVRRKKKKNKDTQGAAAVVWRSHCAEAAAVHIAARPRCEVATLEPITCAKVHDEPLSALLFREHCVVTACIAGNVRVWDRPPLATTV